MFNHLRKYCSEFYLLLVYVLLNGEMVNCSESDKMMKISGKVDKSDTYKGFNSSDISFFIQRI